MIWLILILGFIMLGFLYLAIPACIALYGKQYKTTTLWLIALLNGALIFAVLAYFMTDFRNLAGVLMAGFWSLISFFILRKGCRAKTKIKFCKCCGNELPKDAIFCNKCGTKLPKNNAENRDKKIGWIVIILLLFGFILFLAVGGAVLNNTYASGDDLYVAEESENTTKTPTPAQPVSKQTPEPVLVATPEPTPAPTLPPTAPPTPEPTPQYTCVELTCNNVINANETYCTEHRCANSGCQSKKDYVSPYCGVHTCQSPYCTNAVNGNGRHCAEHTCLANGCTSEKAPGANYCNSHMCASCNNQRIDGGFYCVDHTCMSNGCTQKRYYDYYCSTHRCMAGSCQSEVIAGSYYCQEHTP